MTITLTLPREKSAVIRPLHFGQILRPPLGGPVQQVGRAGNRWAADFDDLDDITDDCARNLIAQLTKAYAQGERVIADLPALAAPSVPGTPLVNGGSQTGSTLNTDGWTAATNKLTWSEAFDNAAWTLTGSSVAADLYPPPPTFSQAAETADKWIEGTNNGAHTIGRTALAHTAAAFLSTSVHMRARGRTAARLVFGSSGGVNGAFADFNFATGATSNLTVLGTGTATSSAMTALGDDWFRCSIVGKSAAAATSTDIHVDMFSGGSNSYQGDGKSGFDLYGAQFEESNGATAYRKATTGQVVVPAGVFFNITVSGQIYLYTLSADAIVNASGQSALPVAPMLRASPADDSAVDFATPKIEGFLSGDASGWRIADRRFHSFGISIEEAA